MKKIYYSSMLFFVLGTTATKAQWGLTGNAATNPTFNYVGTSDFNSLVLRTNNTERMRILNNGNVAIGSIPENAVNAFAGTGGGTLTMRGAGGSTLNIELV